MNPRTLAVAVLMVLAALSRLVDHPPNFTAVTALTLFGAAYLPSRKLALVVPLVVMFFSDLWLEAFTRLGWAGGWMAQGQGFHAMMGVVYWTTFLIAVLGFTLRDRQTAPAVAGVTLLGSVIFFVVTNCGVWALGTMYPHTTAGLRECYLQALPFFGNQLIGDALFVGLLFGGFALAERRVPALAPSAR